MEGSIELERNTNNNMLTQSTLLEKGWTLRMIKKFLPEPILKTNPHYRSGPKMKLWDENTVLSVMETEEFKSAYNSSLIQRNKLSSTLTELNYQKKISQKKEVEALAKTVKISLFRTEEIERDSLKLEEAHLADKGVRYLPNINYAPADFKIRWAVNHIRHNLTDYDIKICELVKIKGNKRFNYSYFKALVLDRIKKVYPKYRKECDLQIKSIWNSYYGKIIA